MTRLLCLTIAFPALLLSSACSTKRGPLPPDFSPLGEGLAVIGYGLVAAAIIRLIGTLRT